MSLEDLKKQIPFKWRVQSFSKSSQTASCVAYIDARDVMDILDQVVGTENWQSDFKEIKGNLYAGVGIRLNNSIEWVWKWDCGTESNTEKEKGEASDAFKRAAVKWGVGRFLYDIPIQYVKSNEKKTASNYPFVVDDNGQKVWDVTEYINKKLGLNKTVTQPKQQVKNQEPAAVQTSENVIDIQKRKDQEQMQKDFIAVKNGTIFQWTNVVKKWLDKKPELAGSESFDKWALKYKPEAKDEVKA